MTEYLVQIQELIVHTLTIEANSEEEARAAGYQLLTDVPAEELQKTHDYDVDAEGFTGLSIVQEL